jgi:hypothetical protein
MIPVEVRPGPLNEVSKVMGYPVREREQDGTPE